MFCKNCGTQIDPSANVCSNCGCQLKTTNTEYLAGKDKTMLIVLAIFLGGWGVHNFVMGETKKGIFRLLTCWFGLGGILALIDIIKIACGSYVVDPGKFF